MKAGEMLLAFCLFAAAMLIGFSLGCHRPTIHPGMSMVPPKPCQCCPKCACGQTSCGCK
jgi:hypothetical protein